MISRKGVEKMLNDKADDLSHSIDLVYKLLGDVLKKQIEKEEQLERRIEILEKQLKGSE